MKIGIIGYGEQGRAAYEYWRGSDNHITICELNEETALPPDVEKSLGPDHLKNLERFDLIVRSPVVHPREIVAANNPDILRKVTTVTNEFFRVCPTKNIIGVTGTKGKGTTSTLIARLLETAGKRVHLGGNIGTAPLDLLKAGIKSEDWVVLELANFQVIDLGYSPHIAVCLMLVPEHLDWHKDFKDYLESKANLFIHQQANDFAIYLSGDDNCENLASHSAGLKIPYYHSPGGRIRNDGMIVIGESETEIIDKSQVKLLGEHNLQNICAALTAFWQVEQNAKVAKRAISGFEGLEHRLEFVRSLRGVKYYNDSFGTNPETAIVAIKAFKQPKIVILGGSDKGADYEQLAKAVKKNNVSQVVLIGHQADRIGQALRAAGFESITEGPELKSMETIVRTAAKLAEEAAAEGGQEIVVLLSTATASFDMFKDYKDRGEQFKAAVNRL